MCSNKQRETISLQNNIIYYLIFLCLHDTQSYVLAELFLPDKYYYNLRWGRVEISKLILCLLMNSEISSCYFSGKLSIQGLCGFAGRGRTRHVISWVCIKYLDFNRKKIQPLLS